MKTKFFNLVLVCIVAFGMCIASCSEGDTTKPSVNLKEPQEGAKLVIGDEAGILLEAVLEDNEMLKSYSVNIHNNFDGHGHDHSRAEGQEGTVAFSFDKSWDISGQKSITISHREIKIPANSTPGNYHFVLFCNDAEGNETKVFRNIELILPAQK